MPGRRGEGVVDLAPCLGRQLGREPAVGRDRVDRGAGLGEALDQPVAAAVAADDEDAAAAPVAPPQFLPERFGVVLRRLGRGRDDRRLRHALRAQALGRARAGRRREKRVRPGRARRHRGEEARHRVGADEDDQAAAGQPLPRVRDRLRIGRRPDLDQRHGDRIDAARHQRVDPGTGLGSGPGDDQARQTRPAHGPAGAGSVDAPAAR